jgi:hypothetical protein
MLNNRHRLRDNFFSAHLPTHISEFPTGWRVSGPEACLRRWRVPRRLANA